MEPHSHFSPTHAIWTALILIAILGTGHLLALSMDNRASRAWIARYDAHRKGYSYGTAFAF